MMIHEKAPYRVASLVSKFYYELNRVFYFSVAITSTAQKTLLTLPTDKEVSKKIDDDDDDDDY